MVKRNQPSSIDALPDEVKDAIGKLRLQGRTIDEILSHLRQMDVEVSRSALGRHVQKMAAVSERMKLSRDMATALVSKFGEEPDNRLSRLNLEMMHSIVLDIMTATRINEETGEPEPITLDPEQAMFLGRTLQSLSAAQKTDQERYLRAKQEALKEAAAALKSVAKAEGMSADLADKLYEAVVLRGAAQ